MVLSAAQEQSLLMSRIEKKYAEGKIPTIHMINRATGCPQKLTPEEQLYHIRQGTEIGKELLKAEKQLMDELQRRAKR